CGHRKRTRDRRCGQHELMRHLDFRLAMLVIRSPSFRAAVARRRSTFVAQGQALMHAETMLLVDNRKAESIEYHSFLHQGMRADCDRRAVRDACERLRAHATLELAREPHDFDTEWRKPFVEIDKVLLGED